MIAFCANKQRRNIVLRTPGLNGIDFAEIAGDPGCGRQIAVTFLKDARGLLLDRTNVRLDGSPAVVVLGLQMPGDSDPLTLTVTLDDPGGFSPYTLQLVAGAGKSDPPDGIDPRLSSVALSFKAGCGTPEDCIDDSCCPTQLQASPDISYLPKEFDGFRQAMLDRMAVLLPDWNERHAADPGITAIEVLAYAADRLSYQQDAVHTEAYLGTARSRISLRRHARLVDYTVGEGLNARVWITAQVGQEVTIQPGTLFYPRVAGLPAVCSPLTADPDRLAASGVPAFASLAATTCQPEQNRMEFYAWGDGGCCLPVGTTSATLVGSLSSLVVGTVLVLEEVLGPLTGDAADADPRHRCAVRLVSALKADEEGRVLVDPANGTPLTAITWRSEDALPFPLCISSVTDVAHGEVSLPAVSVARGNAIPADQGFWVEEPIGTVPDLPAAAVNTGCGSTAGAALRFPRFRPTLSASPLTFCQTFDANTPASMLGVQDASKAAPQITLTASDGSVWVAERDLLEVDETALAFVPEIESDGTVTLRTGDGQKGAAPETGLDFTARYRVGNGTAGNIGRDSIAHIVFGDVGVQTVRNPLPAAGGMDPETSEHIRQYAPFAFQSQLRCVTADDYGAMAEKLAGVREARGTVRWTGSWYTAFTSVDTIAALTEASEESIAESMDGFRTIGTDVVVEGAVLVGLRITMRICVDSGHFASDVRRAVWKVLVTGDPVRGTKGLLDDTNFTFGETVYASPIIAAAQAVDGVRSVTMLQFQRMNAPAVTAASQILMGRLELPRCENDFQHADLGLLTLTMEGGR